MQARLFPAALVRLDLHRQSYLSYSSKQVSLKPNIQVRRLAAAFFSRSFRTQPQLGEKSLCFPSLVNQQTTRN